MTSHFVSFVLVFAVFLAIADALSICPDCFCPPGVDLVCAYNPKTKRYRSFASICGLECVNNCLINKFKFQYKGRCEKNTTTSTSTTTTSTTEQITTTANTTTEEITTITNTTAKEIMTTTNTTKEEITTPTPSFPPLQHTSLPNF